MRGPAAAHEILCDRLHVAVKTALLVGGRPVSPVLVLVGAGLEFHHSRDAMAAQVPAIEELIAKQAVEGGRMPDPGKPLHAVSDRNYHPTACCGRFP